MYKKVLVGMALDHGISPQTLKIAKALCGEGGQIVALHVHEGLHGSVQAFVEESAVQEAFENAQRHLGEKLKGVADVTPAMAVGHTSRTIIDYAESHGFDCIVIGSHKPDLSDYLLGSTASRVVRHAACAVHVHRTT